MPITTLRTKDTIRSLFIPGNKQAALNKYSTLLILPKTPRAKQLFAGYKDQTQKQWDSLLTAPLADQRENVGYDTELIRLTINMIDDITNKTNNIIQHKTTPKKLLHITHNEIEALIAPYIIK